MPEDLVSKNLIRWNQPGGRSYGTVVRVEGAGKRVAVRMDDGEERVFVWPSEVIERLVLDPGDHVRVLSSGAVGVISDVQPHNGLVLYQVNVPGGQSPLVIEDGVRPAEITDPVDRLRAGQLHTARSTNLRLAATRLTFAYQHDELSTLGNSRVELKPHQVGVVHRVAESYPHRFILADEVGLGKTIEAGLLIRELRARGVAQRILILAPSGLVGQWLQELKTKFNLIFSPYTRESLGIFAAERPDENPWNARDLVITSTSYAAYDENRRHDIARAGWDMVIVDEAHHARRTYEGPNRSSQTNLYRLVDEISDPDLARAQAMLLLTATPMQLHPFELFSLIELLDPALFPTFEDFDEHRKQLRGLNATVERFKQWEAISQAERDDAAAAAEEWLELPELEIEQMIRSGREELIDRLGRKHRLSQVMARNRKSVIGGFKQRIAAIWEVELTDLERAAYEALERYVRTGFARSRADQNNAIGFMMSTFQKLNASSSHALLGSLLRRIEKLESVTDSDRRVELFDEIDLDETPTSEALDELLSLRMDADWAEVKDLEKIVALLEQIPLDSKAQQLIDHLAVIAEDDGQAKVIIFTQFRDTQDYLKQRIGMPWAVHLFHGQLKANEKDDAIREFRDGTGAQILLSTEAGGEGRNFQFCHIMINYDLPWNPMKVEQRIGRIDRIGQKHTVTIFNFSTLGTIEERVVHVLSARIGVFKDTIGGLDPILGEVEGDLRKIFRLAAADAERELAALEQRLESKVAQARVAERQLGDLIMDTRSYRKGEVEALIGRERTVSAAQLKSFVLGAMQELGVAIEHDREHPGIYHLRFGHRFEHLFPDAVRLARDRLATFELSVALEREEVDFFAIGHPIVDGLIDHVCGDGYGGITSERMILTDDVARAAGWLFVYVIELSGMTTSRELFPVFIGTDGTADAELARWLVDRAMQGRREDFPDSPPLPARDGIFDGTINVARKGAIEQMLGRQSELEISNAERLAVERAKRERLYMYRLQAAEDKLAANRTILKRLQLTAEGADRRILPVWEKNVSDAESRLASIGAERARRLAELEGRDHVTAQHELFSASYVVIEPDHRSLLAQIRGTLSAEMFARFERHSERIDAAKLGAKRETLLKRREQLITLSKKHRFQVELATRVADALIAAIVDTDRYPASERALINGAIGYYLELDDDQHDLKDPRGFDDDALVARSVLEILGHAELGAGLIDPVT